MESHTSVRVRLDDFDGNDDAASTLSWPPREDDLDREPGPLAVAPPQAEVRIAPSDRREAAGPSATLRTGPARRSSRLVRLAVAALAAVALVQAVIIALHLWDNDTMRQVTAAVRDRFGVQSAGTSASSAAPRDTAAPPQTEAASLPPPAPAAVTGDAGGQLQVQSDRSGVTVLVDGERRGTTPLTVPGLAPGPHRIRLVEGDRSIEHTVVVEAGVATSLVLPMGRAGAGWLELLMPFEVRIVEDGRLVGTSAQSRLQFAAGDHRFELANDAVGYRAVQTVRVKPGEVAIVRPEVPSGLLHINATPWAEVWIDGRPAGTTPLGNVRVALGSHEVRFRHPELGDETRRVLVTATEPARVSLEFRP